MARTMPNPDVLLEFRQPHATELRRRRRASRHAHTRTSNWDRRRALPETGVLARGRRMLAVR